MSADSQTESRVAEPVGFAADLVALNLMQAFKFAVDQNVTEFEILDENDRGAVVDYILQPLFASRAESPRPSFDRCFLASAQNTI